MIITIHGKDNFRSRRELEKLIAHHRKKHSERMSFEYFDSKSVGERMKNIKDFFSQFSMFKEPKLAVVENWLNLSNLEDIKAFSGFENDLLVFFEDDEITGKNLSFIEKYGKVYHLRPLTGIKLESWISKEINSRGGSIEKQAVQKMIGLLGNNLWTMNNEIEKLLCYKSGEEIVSSDVDVLIKPLTGEGNIFKAVDYIVSGERAKAFSSVYDQLDKGDSVFYLLTMIALQYRNLIIAKTGSGNRPRDIHPYVLQKAAYQAARYSLGDLKRIYQKLIKIDLDIKTGKIEKETALDLLLAGLR